MNITVKLVNELNNELAAKGCVFRYKFEIYDCTKHPQLHLVLVNSTYVESFIINPTKEYFDWLILWFKIRGITISGNNDGTILWESYI